MAKKAAAAKATEQTDLVTIQHLAEEFEAEARIIRAFIRGLGLKAPKLETEGFGPRAKYTWEAGSKELAAIRKAWADKANASETPAEEEAPKGKKGKK